MRHHKTNRKFGRKRNARTALLRGLALSLIAHSRISTTEAKAKELRGYVEKLVTKALRGDLASIRHIASRLGNQTQSAKKLVSDIAPKYKERAGGYTRIIKTGQRAGDASPMAIIEFV